MTKLLYIPTGEFIKFPTTAQMSYTKVDIEYENSNMWKSYAKPLYKVRKQLCSDGLWAGCVKIINKFPHNAKLYEFEFEIIYD